MKNESLPLPDENIAVETVLDGTDEDIGTLLKEQPSLAEFVQDVQSIKEGLKSIEDEEPPPFCIDINKRKKDRSLFSRLQNLPLDWYKNPYILTFGFVMAIILFYFCIVILLEF